MDPSICEHRESHGNGFCTSCGTTPEQRAVTSDSRNDSLARIADAIEALTLRRAESHRREARSVAAQERIADALEALVMLGGRCEETREAVERIAARVKGRK